MKIYRRSNGKYYVNYRQFGVYKKVSTHTNNYELAQRFATNFLKKIYESEKLHQRTELTFKEAANKFNKESNNKSKKDDISLLKGLEQFFGSTMLLSEINHDKVQSFRRRQLYKNISEKTINRYLQKLKRLLKVAKKNWQVNVQEFEITLYKEHPADITPLNEDEVKRLIDASPQWFANIIVLAVETGLRQKNLLELKWSQINLQEKSITFRTSEVLKNDNAFAIPLSTTAFEMLESIKDENNEHVFCRQGKPIKWFPTKVWTNIRKDANVKCRFHDLRHTWATNHVKKGTPFEILQKLGNWKDRKMVEKYAHFSVETLARYVD